MTKVKFLVREVTINNIIDDSKSRMETSLASLKSELTKLRVDRANPSLLDHIKVTYYNVEMPLVQVATVAVENPRTLSVIPWEGNMVGLIEKAIQTANLGLNPLIIGTVIRVPLPPLTEERRKELARVVRSAAEKSRVIIRNIRREANNNLKELIKRKEISEDEERRAQITIQKLTDTQIAEVNKMAFQKGTDLMTV